MRKKHIIYTSTILIKNICNDLESIDLLDFHFMLLCFIFILYLTDNTEALSGFYSLLDHI